MKNVKDIDFKSGFYYSLNSYNPNRGFLVRMHFISSITCPEEDEIREFINIYSELLSEEFSFIGGGYCPRSQRYLLEIWAHVDNFSDIGNPESEIIYDVYNKKIVDGKDEKINACADRMDLRGMVSHLLCFRGCAN